MKPNGGTHVLFPKNEPLPARKKQTLTTSKDGQRTLVLRMYQGEGDHVEDCELLGSFVFNGLRNAPRGDVRLEVTFHIDSEGILNLSAIDEDTGDAVQAQISLERDDNTPKKRKKKKKTPEVLPELEMPAISSLGAEEIEELEPEAIEPAEAPEEVVEEEPEPAPDISSLRSQMTRPAGLDEEEKEEATGVWGWILRLLGLA